MGTKRELSRSFRAASIVADIALSQVDPLRIIAKTGTTEEAVVRRGYAQIANRILVRSRNAKDVDSLAMIVSDAFDKMVRPGSCSPADARKIASQMLTSVRRLQG